MWDEIVDAYFSDDDRASSTLPSGGSNLVLLQAAPPTFSSNSVEDLGSLTGRERI